MALLYAFRMVCLRTVLPPVIAVEIYVVYWVTLVVVGEIRQEWLVVVP